MKDIYLPDYNGGSIVNLMSSIGRSFGTKMKYPPLRILPPERIKAKNVVLMVIDGLGYEYLKNNRRRDTVLGEHLAGSMTSVFLPTTASAIGTYLSGEAPQQHALTGWYVYLKEFGAVSVILPFIPRFGGMPYGDYGINIKKVVDARSFTSKIKVPCYQVNNERVAYSHFNTLMSEKSKVFAYKDKNLDDFFRKAKKAIKSNNRKKYVFAYWPTFDSLTHKYGTRHRLVKAHFNELNKKIAKFVKSLKGTDTLLIISADHGLMDVPGERAIKLEDHPKLAECLALPFSGDSRTVYCYVRPSKTKQFERYVKTELKDKCYMFKSEDVIKKGYLGLFEPNPKLKDRLGDSVLIGKRNYHFKDNVISVPSPGRKKKAHLGDHGGVSKEEMLVPLILIDIK